MAAAPSSSATVVRGTPAPLRRMLRLARHGQAAFEKAQNVMASTVERDLQQRARFDYGSWSQHADFIRVEASGDKVNVRLPHEAMGLEFGTLDESPKALVRPHLLFFADEYRKLYVQTFQQALGDR